MAYAEGPCCDDCRRGLRCSAALGGPALGPTGARADVVLWLGLVAALAIAAWRRSR